MTRLPLRLRRREAWGNHTGNQRVDPLCIVDAKSCDDLVRIVKKADSQKLKVRAVGSGHSWSDIAITPDYLVKTHQLNEELEVECVRQDYPDADRLVRTQAGVKLKKLNRRLWRKGLAMANLGGWDEQTLAGVLSTSTHGSGEDLGPICDQVVSLDIVASDGTLIRIEREDGPTDGPAFKAKCPEWDLKPDDDWFNAALVGLGCMGIIYAVTLEAAPRSYLCETRTVREWSEVDAELRARSLITPQDGDVRHVEIYVNVHRWKGRRRCLVTKRAVVDELPPWYRFWQRHRRIPATLFGLFAPISARFLDVLTNWFPKRTPWVVDTALWAIKKDKYVDRSYRVLKLGTANLMPSYASEIGVELDPDHEYLAAVERVFEIARKREEAGKVYSTAPISLRFVKRSPAFLSMMHDRDTLMIELIQLSRTKGGFELLAAYEDALYDCGGRPHWGMYNGLTGSHRLVESMYPRYQDWLAVHSVLNRTGVFDSPFSKRVGICRRPYSAKPSPMSQPAQLRRSR